MSISTSAMPGKSPNSGTLAEAERWYARLKAPDCAGSERMEFQRWKSVPEHAAAYAATERLWNSLSQLAGRPDLEALSRQVLADTALERSRPAWHRMAIAAAVLLVAVGVGLFWAASGNREAPAVVYATQPGERSTIKLADGSQLVLNFATELDVRLDKKVRYLTLRKGEALFTVAHDAKRPFKVIAGDGEVTALGTRFQVRNEARQIAVTLVEGRIAVDRSKEGQHLRLAPGDQVRFTDASPELKRRTVDPQMATSWTSGRLLFRSTPLREALAEVNRYSAKQIRVDDPQLMEVPISGTFEVMDADSVIVALEGLFPLQVRKQDQAEVVLGPR